VRLISFRSGSGETLAVVAGDRWIAAAALVAGGPATMGELLSAGDPALGALRAAADPARIAAEGAPVEEVELLAPVPHPGKVVGIGRNYREHIDEEGTDPPGAPLVFAKWPTAVIGDGAEIRWDPGLTGQVDWEAELGVVIGRRARRVAETEALDYVLGYTCLNDVSARDIQFGDGQWVRGKSLDTFCPMGPALLTTDEIGDPQDLAIGCTVGAERVQDARTSQMYFGVAAIVSYCSRSFTLEPGDVIATGTPSGVGAGRGLYLRGGDVVRVTIDGLGTLENTVIDPTEETS
jgi:5-carboxymethyl-2-hydroxymuconate isomerase